MIRIGNQNINEFEYSLNSDEKFVIHATPKNGAQGINGQALPHYLNDDHGVALFNTRESAQFHINDLEEDGLCEFWNYRIRSSDNL